MNLGSHPTWTKGDHILAALSVAQIWKGTEIHQKLGGYVGVKMNENRITNNQRHKPKLLFCLKYHLIKISERKSSKCGKANPETNNEKGMGEQGTIARHRELQEQPPAMSEGTAEPLLATRLLATVSWEKRWAGGWWGLFKAETLCRYIVYLRPVCDTFCECSSVPACITCFWLWVLSSQKTVYRKNSPGFQQGIW